MLCGALRRPMVWQRGLPSKVLSRSLSAKGSSYDYIIVGAGSSGSVLASRLCADPSTSVLLLEAGEDDSYTPIHVPVGYLWCIANPRTDWCFKTSPQSGLHGKQLNYPRGKVLGGSSSINGMIYNRGQKADYDEWAQLTEDSDWTWDSLLPLWKSHEDYHGFRQTEDSSIFNNNLSALNRDESHMRTFHGKGGPWTVSTQRYYSAAMNIFREAAIEHGIPPTGDFNTGTQNGVGFFDVNQRRGWRLTAFQAFVAPLLQKNSPNYRPNLTVMSSTQVQQLLFETTANKHDASSSSTPKCVGVEAVRFRNNVDGSHGRGGDPMMLNAKREVILCSGSIGSVQILERSGIGQAERLRKLEGGGGGKKTLKIISDVPGVGENLRDHMQIRPVFGVSNMPNGTFNTAIQSWPTKIKMAWDYATKQEGALTVAPSQLGAYVASSDKYRHRPNLEFHIQPLSLGAFGSAKKYYNGSALSHIPDLVNTVVKSPLEEFDAITASVVNVNPTSVGSVHISSTDISSQPVIDPCFLSSEEDRQVAIDSLKLMRDIVMKTETFRPYSPVEMRPTADCITDDALLEAARNLGTTIFHPVGTVKMGKITPGGGGDPLAVVDSKLRVRGVRSLRVADASIMPVITSGNTAAPTMAIAENCARFILAEYGRGN